MLPFLDGELLLEELEKLAQIGRNPAGGLNRTAYSPTDLEGRRWIEAKMGQLGLDIQNDAAGNSIALYPGRADLPPIALGSHTDTVPEGGDYDGSLGVLAALAAVRALKAAGIQLRHPVEVINFAAEEATMSGGTTGSVAMIGRFDPAILDKPAWDSRPVKTHLLEAGLDPASMNQAKRSPGTLAAYMELHIEQSDYLERQKLPVAIVEGIVSIRRYIATFYGYANHAGTTSMASRQDALVMAAPFITLVREVAIDYGIVGTIGKLEVYPGAPNVIPGQVELIVETRGLDTSVLDKVEAKLAAEAKTSGADFTRITSKPPVESDPRIIEAMSAACDELGLAYLKMPSGAGHDAMSMAHICPQGMIFVPSKDGVSHSPDEYTDPESCVIGARVLLAALINLDKVLDAEEL